MKENKYKQLERTLNLLIGLIKVAMEKIEKAIIEVIMSNGYFLIKRK